jgi:hypothetical protein
MLAIFLAACGSAEEEEPTITTGDLQWITSQLDLNFRVEGIACYDNTVVAVGSEGRVATSTNGGSTWSTRDVVPNNLHDVARCGSHFITVGDNQSILWSSDNGSRWTQVNMSADVDNNGIIYLFQGIHYQSIACDGTAFVMAGETTLPDNNTNYDNLTARSINNGASWKTFELKNLVGDSSKVAINQLVYGDGYYYIATDEDNLGYSADGITWETPTRTNDARFDATGLTSGAVTDIGTGHTIRMMSQNRIVDNFTNPDNASVEGRLFVSYDDIASWSEESLPTAGGVYGVAFGGNRFIAVMQDMVYRADNFTDFDNITATRWVEDRPLRAGGGEITTVTSCSDTFWVGTDRGQIFRARY